MQTETSEDSWNFDNFVHWLYVNRKAVGIVSAIVVVAGAAIGIYTWKKNQDEANANAALFALPSMVSPRPHATTAHAEDFKKIAAEYPNTTAGEHSALAAGGVLFSEGKFAEAQAQFAKFLQDENADTTLKAQAALGVAASLESQGKVEDAVARYQEVITQYQGENVISPAKLTLAGLLEKQNKLADALRLYEDLARSQNNYDLWAAEAGERRQRLLKQHPELVKRTEVSAAPSGMSAIPFPVPSATTTNINSVK